MPASTPTRPAPSRSGAPGSWGTTVRAGQLLRWELPLLRHLESEGYDVTYGSGGEFARYTDVLEGIGMLVFGGHDEYWTTAQRRQVDDRLAAGELSIGHFGANAAYWRVRLEPSADGRRDRRIACFKDEPALDPVPNSTIRFRDNPGENAEHRLLGNGYVAYAVGGFPLVVTDADHWLFEGTGLVAGDTLPGLVGYEFDGVLPNWTPADTRVVFESPTLTTTGLPSLGQGVIRETPQGRVVFSAGTIYFPLALAMGTESRDDRLARLTSNVLERGLRHRRPSRPLAPAGPTRIAEPSAIGPFATEVRRFAGEGGDGGFRDGDADKALFNGPTALLSMFDDSVLVADTGNNRIRRISPDGRHVFTIAGDGAPGDRDGDGAAARFRQPTGMVLLSDGSVLVADQLNHTLRRLQKAGGGRWTVSTWAGAPLAAGATEGVRTDARFNRPAALAVDADGSVYVADQGNGRIRRISADTGEVTTIAGQRGTGDRDAAEGSDARFSEPSALAIHDGQLFVFDAGNGRLRRISLVPPYEVRTIAGQSADRRGFADGKGEEARFRGQLGLAATNAGEILLADAGNNRLRIVTPGPDRSTTQVRTLVGSGRAGRVLGTGDMTSLNVPTGVAVRRDGTVIVTDSGRNVVLTMRR